MQISDELKWASGLLMGCSVAFAVPAASAAAPELPAQTSAPAVQAAPGNMPATDWRISSGDWGGVGLLQTPSARMYQPSTFGLHFSHAWPYRNSNLLLQPFEDLEVVMRYTSISSRSYGPSTPDLSYMDKSMELKYRVLKESGNQPELAVGMRDPLGTGLFAGEYLVANKSLGSDVDLSLGLGWGYLGGRGDMANPLGVFGSHFKERQNAVVGEGGMPRGKSWFTGPVALLGGVQWKTPWDPLVLKLEYDGNRYQNEPGGAAVVQKSPINVAALWRFNGFDVNLGWQRGNRVSLSAGWMLDGNKIQPLQITKPPEPLPLGRALPAEGQGDAEKTMGLWHQHTGWDASALHQQGPTYIVDVNNAGGTFVKERLDQGAKVLDRYAPEDVHKFIFRFHSAKVPVSSVELDRPALVHAEPAMHPVPAQPSTQQIAQQVAQQVAQPVTQQLTQHPANLAPTPEAPFKTLFQPAVSQFSGKVEPSFDQRVGGPDGYLYAISAKARGRVDLWDGAWVNGAMYYRLADNYERIFYTAPTGLPRVRTELPQYLQTSRLTIPTLQFNQMNQWGQNVYSLGYVGLLESMYAGAGAEMLYRPNQSNFGIGFDLNAVQQRSFNQRFGVRDYSVTTGHVNAYWDTKWHGVQVNLSAGQYLAGDKGATLELARVFDNGITMGLWATKTNASAAQFGEGSFDKGVFISVPLDVLFKNTAGVASLAWHPLLRDGGARLARTNTLWALTRLRDSRAMQYATSPER